MSNPPADKRGRPAGRKLAEWVTLTLSALLVLGVAAYLVYEALRETAPFASVEVQVRTERAQQKGGRYIVPVEVRNGGRQTLKDLKLEVTYRWADGAAERGDVLIDYLGERSSHTVYLYFDRAPEDLQVTATPFAYQLD